MDDAVKENNMLVGGFLFHIILDSFSSPTFFPVKFGDLSVVTLQVFSKAGSFTQRQRTLGHICLIPAFFLSGTPWSKTPLLFQSCR